MTVKRIIANIATADLNAIQAFYRDIFDLELVMDHGWIQTYASSENMRVQLSAAIEGGSGTAVPDLSIEVDNLDIVLQKIANQHIEIVYGPAIESWGVRRFYINDPGGRLLNVLQHLN